MPNKQELKVNQSALPDKGWQQQTTRDLSAITGRLVKLNYSNPLPKEVQKLGLFHPYMRALNGETKARQLRGQVRLSGQEMKNYMVKEV
jgi:hypothetical protein